jgi:hypothetical protein
MIGDTLEVIPLNDIEPVLKLSRGPLVVEGLWRGDPRKAMKMLPQLRQRLHIEWQKGPPPEMLQS